MANVSRIVRLEFTPGTEDLEVEAAELGGRGFVAVQCKCRHCGASEVLHVDAKYDDGKVTRQQPVRPEVSLHSQPQLTD